MSEGWNWTRLDDKFTCLRVAGYCLDASVTRCAGSFVLLLSLQEFGTCAREVHRGIRTHILWICYALLETFWNFIREYNMIMGKFIMVNIYIDNAWNKYKTVYTNFKLFSIILFNRYSIHQRTWLFSRIIFNIYHMLKTIIYGVY